MGTPMMEPAQAEDSQLVQETLAGNRMSFQLLVERYEGRLFSLARHYTRNPVDAEDIVQEAFLKAFRRLDSFDGRSSFYTWIYRIAVNTVLDVMKRRGRSPVQNVEDPELVGEARPVSCPAPDAGLHTQEVSEITHRVLEELPEIFRTVLVLREFEEQSYQAIADLLGISIGTVESRLFRARAKFKQKLLALYPEFGGA
ncbi:MAG: sigma-70 family RNA polymerase sigma factor [Planctomycetes bacterium]|nr:sigma-70 family RNA polymerase sigma factor [Planctomycetota bacterium]MCB9904995.1 sigma-70 family RNA polymerase sigma factor [Planctomycetota bacterium]